MLQGLEIRCFAAEVRCALAWRHASSYGQIPAHLFLPCSPQSVVFDIGTLLPSLQPVVQCSYPVLAGAGQRRRLQTH